jgi:hypothetical protein
VRHYCPLNTRRVSSYVQGSYSPLNGHPGERVVSQSTTVHRSMVLTVCKSTDSSTSMLNVCKILYTTCYHVAHCTTVCSVTMCDGTVITVDENTYHYISQQIGQQLIMALTLIGCYILIMFLYYAR